MRRTLERRGRECEAGCGAGAARKSAVIVQKRQAASILVAHRVRNAEAELICRKYFVGGRVQGVFYRATAARYARELQLTGYARNLPDGRVEVLACGSGAALEELLKRLWIGSSASKVTSVEVADAAPAADLPTDFITG
jgi:acylphosphatase